MPRLLFIAYDFPPGAAVGAGLRSASFVRHLPEHGWQPTVLALDGGQAEAQGVVRLASRTPWRRPYELTPYGWAYALQRWLRQCGDHFDLVYVTCPPFPQALVAAGFAHRRRVPLVADFRDAWSLDPYQEGSRLKKLLYRHLFPRWERRLLRDTDLLILNTPSALRAYRALYPGRARSMIWLPNGYSEGAFPRQPEPPSEYEMVLLHAGRFGIGARTPVHLIDAMALARQQGCRVRLEILGNQPETVREAVRAAGMESHVTLVDQVDYVQAVTRMCSAGVLVLVQAPAAGKVQAVAGKTFDYLRAGRPILAIAPEGDNLDLVRRHAPRYECPADDPQAIATAICNLWREWQRGLLRERQVDVAAIQQYERQTLAAQLAGQLDRLMSKQRD